MLNTSHKNTVQYIKKRRHRIINMMHKLHFSDSWKFLVKIHLNLINFIGITGYVPTFASKKQTKKNNEKQRSATSELKFLFFVFLFATIEQIIELATFP